MLRQGDIVCIYKLDRLGRSMKHLLELVEEFSHKSVGLLSLTDAIGNTTAQGRLVLNLLASLAEMYYKEGLLSVNLIAKKLTISKVRFYKYLWHQGVEIHSKQNG